MLLVVVAIVCLIPDADLAASSERTISGAQAAISGVEVELKQLSSTDNKLTFQCTVINYDNRWKVHFHCSIKDKVATDERCFEDCVRVRGKISQLLTCSKKELKNSTIFEYQTYKTVLPSGSYHCSYINVESHKISHTQDKKITINTTSEPKSSPEFAFPQQMRIDITILLLSILSLSLIVNVLFFVRCFMVRHMIRKESSSHISPAKRSVAACLCIDSKFISANNYHKAREDIYDNIRDLPLDSDTTKSKSSSGRDSQNVLITPVSSQMTRSSTFPYKQSVLVRTPTDQIALTQMPLQPYMMPYITEDGQCVMGTLINHRLSSHGLYDDIAVETASTMPIRHFASTGSLNHRPKRFLSSHAKASPLPEEHQVTNPEFTFLHRNKEEEVEFTANDISSTYDVNSSEDPYISGKESDSFKDPVRSAKLEMSREMMAKADTLLREAHNLLKHS